MSQRLAVYHRRHRLHRRAFRTAAAVFMLSVLGIIFCLQVFAARQMVARLAVGVTEEVEAEEPVAIIGGGAGSSPLFFPSPTSEPLPQGPDRSGLSSGSFSLELLTGAEGEAESVITEEAGQTRIPRIRNRRPIFKGKAAVANALIYLEMHSEPVESITTTFAAEEDGRWQWQPPRELSLGEHVLYMLVFDAEGQHRIAAATLHFIIIGSDQSTSIESGEISALPALEPRTDLVIPQSLLDQRKVLFDIKTAIIGEEPSEIRPGDTILAKISLLNIGQPGFIADALVRYSIIDVTTNRLIFEESETIGVSTSASYLKMFALSTNVPEGRYRLEATVVYNNVEAYSFDDFSIMGQTIVAPMIFEAKADISQIVQLLSLLCLAAAGIMYFEYHAAEAARRLIRQVTEQDLRKQGMI